MGVIGALGFECRVPDASGEDAKSRTPIWTLLLLWSRLWDKVDLLLGYLDLHLYLYLPIWIL